MQTRRLGRLGHESSVLILGCAALGSVDQATADDFLQKALGAGVNHIDVARSYGEAELRLGPNIPAIRDQVFLATKTGERGAEGARRELGESLERLRTDRVDLLQLHAIGTLDELDLALAPGGALEAAVRAQEEGMVGAIGITGHGPQAAATHLEALRRYPFATVLTPLNAALWRSQDFRADYERLVDEVRRQDVGLMTIKTGARRNWPGVGAGEELGEQPMSTWYEPHTDAEVLRAAVSWVLAHEEVTGLATPGDVGLLDDVLAAEAERMQLGEAQHLLDGVEGYSSPFEAMPAGL